MIRYYKLYRRVGRLGSKYADEATMDWMESEPKVWSIDKIRVYLLELTLTDFISEWIKIFKEDTLDYIMLIECLNFHRDVVCSNGKLMISKNLVYLTIKADEEIDNIQVKKMIIEVSSNHNKLDAFKSQVIKVDEYYFLEITKTYDAISNKIQLTLEHKIVDNND